MDNHTYNKVEIEGAGVFSVPLPVWELLRDESTRAAAADDVLGQTQAERDEWRAECERLRAQVAQAKVDGANEERSLHWMSENTEIAALREQVATLRYALQFVMSATGNRLSITSMNVATSALEATYNTSQDAT